MPRFTKEYISSYSIEQIFAIVTDIERYPEFLPWCKAVRIIDESNSEMVADMVISFKAFTEHYRSKVTFTPPKRGKATIHADLISGPFKFLKNYWSLKTIKNTKTHISFLVDFEFKSALLENMVGLFFSKATEK